MAKPARKKGLGKGLQALIPQIDKKELYDEVKKEDRVKDLDINRIFPNENQPRKDFNREKLEELAESIKNHGLIQPIVVIEVDNGFMIVAGERRWRAARIAELKKIPCIIKNYKEQSLIEVAIIENIQRQELNIMEEARAYKYIIETYGVTQEELGQAIGKSRSYIANILRLLQLDDKVMEMIMDDEISPGHGRALLGLGKGDKQYAMAQKIVRDNLNVRQVEKLMKDLSEPRQAKTKEKDIMITALEDNLKKVFGTKVSIIKGRKKGKIEIEYYGQDDLDRILSLLDMVN